MRLFVITFAAALFIGPTLVIASETTVTVEGMHCSGCKKMVTKNVCEDQELAATFEKCSVKILDEKKQIGQIKITPKANQVIDMAKIEAAIKSAGDDFKVTKKETK